MQENLTFRGGEPFWANACVGNNGHPDYFDYAKGYSAAANLLITAVLDGRGINYPVDQFVYPICFNMRHSVELRLKGAVSSLDKISKSRAPLPEFNLKGSHDIGKIWGHIKNESMRLDERFGTFINGLDGFILDISMIDATGQTFRYPDDNENIKHLVSVASINIYTLYRRFSVLEKLLDCFEAFCKELVSEYSWGTYTTKLSRAQLCEIARALPRRELWGDPSFGAVKQELRSRYKISSNDLSKAIKKIEISYGIAQPSLKPPPLKFIKEEELYAFFDAWLHVNGIDESKTGEKITSVSFDDINSVSKSIEEAIRHSERKQAVWPSVSAAISSDGIADLYALYYCWNARYPEEYACLSESYQKEIGFVHNCSAEQYNEYLINILGKSLAFERTIKSLYLIGHQETAESLIEKYGFSGSFKWIDRAKSGELFVEPWRQLLNGCEDVIGSCAI